MYSLDIFLFLFGNQSVVPHPVLTVASWSAYRFLKRQVRLSGYKFFFICQLQWIGHGWLEHWVETGSEFQWSSSEGILRWFISFCHWSREWQHECLCCHLCYNARKYFFTWNICLILAFSSQSFDTYLSSTNCVPENVLSAEDTAVNKNTHTQTNIRL